MAQTPDYSIEPLTDRSLLIRFGSRISRKTHEKVLRVFYVLQAEKHPFIVDLVPSYASLGVVYDLVKSAELPGEGSISSKVARMLEERLLTVTDNRKMPQKRRLEVPVCYDTCFALDLEDLAGKKQLTPQDIIGIHCAKLYDVYLLGFLPGFAYMGIVDDRIATPRRSTPRTLVPRGSVGIAGNQTGIYPSDSPGGWQIIGRTPVELFNPSADQPSFFLPGDEVKFYPITKHEFENY